MKKSYKILGLIIALLFTCGNINAQLSVQTSGNNKDNVIAKDAWSKVIFNYDGFYLCVKDAYTPNMIYVFLGKEQENALSSLEYLYEWVKTSNKKEYIVLEQEDKNVTIYKTQESQFMVSYGSPDFCQEMFKAQMLNAFVGGNYWQRNSIRNEMFGYCANVFLKRAIKQLDY